MKLSEISSAEFELWGDPILFESLISRVQLDSDIQVMFLDGQGRLLYSSNSGDLPFRGKTLNLPGIAQTQNGKETAFTNYSILNLSNVQVDVYEPVMNASNQVIGIVRLTYTIGSLYDIFDQLRFICPKIYISFKARCNNIFPAMRPSDPPHIITLVFTCTH